MNYNKPTLVNQVIIAGDYVFYEPQCPNHGSQLNDVQFLLSHNSAFLLQGATANNLPKISLKIIGEYVV